MTSARKSALPGATRKRQRQPLFINPQAAEIVIASLMWLQENDRIRLMGFVVMPDHVHVAFVLTGRGSLAKAMDSMKGYTGKILNESLQRHGPIWQNGYRDHFVRDRRDFETRLSYMHGNPIRKGLVRYEHEYEFSSANPRYLHLVDWAWLDGVGRARKGALTGTTTAEAKK